jgi:dipeptidyl aminopeptidase/acylaminoacyl peptidase
VARQITKLGVSVRAAAWSPDSRRLAIIADSHERDEYTYERADLWVVDQAGGEGGIRRLTDDGYEYSSPAWSADGRSLVFLRSQSLNQVIASKQNHGAKIDIYRMPAGGGEMENLTAPFDLIPAAPASNPDGRSIYFTAAVGGDAQLFRMPAAGGKAEPVQSGGRLVRRGFSLSAAMDRMAYVEGDSTDPGNVYSARTDGTAGLRLTDVNDELLARLTLNQARGIHYRSDDGTEIEGWVVFPRSYDPLKGKYPLILNIHGGPHGAFSSGFSFETQLLAARGYIVVFTNPRGSTGYGEKFLWGTWGGWGVLDYQDVMAGVRFVEQGFAVDPKRMGVGGYSYGGFLTNWIITQTDRFAAAVTGAGISNWVSDYGTADIPRTKESEFFGAPWDPRGGELLRKYSPITYVNKARTPTLFVHGESDMRVPIEEAEQMYTALKKQHVQAKMVRYPDTYHGGWTPWNTVHRYWQELQWWDEYLMPGK